MILNKKIDFYKISVSILFGLLGFFFNFHTIIFPFGDYTVAILFGLLFPLLIALSWGWKYGLLSALAGGCQSMWWLWGPSNGYAIFLVVPPFTLWIVWHGVFAGIRRKQKKHKWWLNIYVLEIPFRLLCSISLLTACRWAITLNPPPWNWASDSVSVVPMHFSVFVVINQASVAFVILLLAEVLLNFRFVRKFFKLKQLVDYRKTGHILSSFLLLGCLFWVLDSLFHAFVFHNERYFIDFLALDIPDRNIFTRIVFFIFCVASGLVTSKILRRQREGEIALRESEEELYQIIQRSFIATLVIDKDHEVIHWNKAAEHLTGITAEQIIHTQNQWRPFYTEKRPILADFIADGASEQEIKKHCGEGINESSLIEGAYQGERFFSNIGEKGKWLFFTAAPLKNKSGKITGAIETFQDINNRKQAEEDVKANEIFLRTLIRTIPDLVWLKDRQGVYLACNSRFERFFGSKESDIIGKTDYDFVDGALADSFREHDRIAMAKGKPSINEEEVVFADDGHRELLETIKTPMYSTEGRLTGVLGIGRNITERADLQAQLVQAQKMESIGRLAGGVAHDFNNMLTIILGNTEMALEDLDPSNPEIPYLHEVQKAAQRSTDLTRQLLAFARKQTISPKVLDLNQTLEGMLKMLRRLIGEDIDLIWQPGAGLWQVNIDPSQIDQILANLCVNARDSIKGTGRVAIETENVHFDRNYCRNHAGFKPGEYVLTAVSDNGCGMGRETIDNLFEPFFTTKGVGEGTGLGLATVYGIVKQNKGFINVYSELEIGTTFRIYLPKYAEKAGDKKQKKPGRTVFHGHETILLVEDEKTILKMTQMILQRLGYTVLTALTPEEAFQKFNEYDSGKIHLLMTDVVMPKMNGRDLADKLLGSSPDLKCLFMSGYTANVIAHHGILDEGLNFINKPFSKQELSIKLREILDKP